MVELRPHIHPGEVLREEFLKPTGVAAGKLAEDIKIPLDRISALIECQGAICVDTALRLSHYFGTSERFWLEMQLVYDLEAARRGGAYDIRSEITPLV